VLASPRVHATSLPGHTIFLLLVELALLVGVARVGAEVAKRIGLPAVVGEMTGGIVLGPSVFGHYAPAAFAAVFPSNVEQLHLLEAFGTVGMCLLLLLTGLETDLRLLRNLGRAALIASVMGMVLPFGLGFGLGYVMPGGYLVDPDHRILFSLFLATTMSISAMPVIAKILVDLDLTKRNIGLVILSAGVVDDTVGWLILSLIAGAATHGAVHAADLGLTVLWLFAFILGAAFVLFPMLRIAVRATSERFRSNDSDLVLIIVVTFLCAAATERIGVHPVFGAFVAGVVLHQVPRLRKETVVRLESFTFGVLAPIFFGIVGLHVNLWDLGGGKMLAVVITVACLGKLVGCALGAYWGGLRFWEASSIAVAMNARGAMGIVVATIGLSLAILTPQMFSIIVMMAIVTSFMAPVGLRLTMPRVRMTEEEARRILASESTGAFDPGHVRVLLATAGGPNALAAAPLAFGLAKKSSAAVKILHVEAELAWWRQLLRPFGRPAPAGVGDHFDKMRALAGDRAPEIVKERGPGVAPVICEEARRGCDLIVIGSGYGPSIGGAVVEQVVSDAPCHVAILKTPAQAAEYRRLLVPVDGSIGSRLAVELALRYAEATGAELTLAIMTERRPQAAAYADLSGLHQVPEAPTTGEEELARISVVFRASPLKPSIIHLAYDPRSSPVAEAVEKGNYDLVVLGTENRAVQHRLFFGYENERLIRATRVPVLVVVPNLARLPISDARPSGVVRARN
jgi:Kef-type K+ transport system membrane component KefB/nucleotide-binding universal stress UspA family protein